jgi:hypothetical protein
MFESGWAGLRLHDDDLRVLQLSICLAPQSSPVIPGCGGLRKMRFSPPSWRKGKSGALRVLYAHFPDHAVCVLAAVYAKNVQENINAKDKRSLKLILEDIAKQLDREQGSQRDI